MKGNSAPVETEKTPHAALALFFGLLSVILLALVVSYTLFRSSETEVLGKTTNQTSPKSSAVEK